MDFLKEKLSEVFNKDSWEVKTLGDIAEAVLKGNSKINAEYKDSGDLPAITGKEVVYSQIFINKIQIFINPLSIEKKVFIEKGDLLIVDANGSQEYLGKAAVYLGDEKCIAGNHIFVVKHSQNPQYLAHLFSSQYIRSQIRALCTGSSIPGLNKADFLKIKLLLPNLETQNRIVEFLDKFVHLKSELAFEKEKRMKQFEHYRNSIFGRNEEEILWEIRSLGEIATEIYSGNGVTREQLGTGNYPAIKAGDVNTGLPIQFKKCISFVNPDLIKNKRFFEYGDILMSNLSSKLETLGRATVYLGNERGLNGLGVTVIKHKQNSKYLAYVLSTDFCQKQIRSVAQKGTVCNLYASNIKQLRIPFPDLEIQNEIANSLSRFIELSSEIDCELKLTNKQYEYYKESIFETKI